MLCRLVKSYGRFVEACCLVNCLNAAEKKRQPASPKRQCYLSIDTAVYLSRPNVYQPCWEKLRFRTNSSSLHRLNHPDPPSEINVFTITDKPMIRAGHYPCASFRGSAPVIHVFPDNLKLRTHARKQTSILMGLNYVVRNATARKFTAIQTGISYPTAAQKAAHHDPVSAALSLYLSPTKREQNWSTRPHRKSVSLSSQAIRTSSVRTSSVRTQFCFTTTGENLCWWSHKSRIQYYSSML